MKKPMSMRSNSFCLLLTLCALLLAHPLMAEERSHISIGLAGGLCSPQSPSSFSQSYDTSQSFGGLVKFKLKNQWAMSVKFIDHTFKSKSNHAHKINLQPVTAVGHYRFMKKETFWNPYVSLGLGLSRNKRTLFDQVKTDTKTTFSLGAGVELNLTDLTSVSMELTHQQFAGASNGGHSLQTMSTGLMVNFYIPDSWIPVQLKEPLNLRDIEDRIDLAVSDEENDKRQAQQELDKVQQDIEDKKIPPIHFETGQAVLLPASFETLDIVGTILRRYPHLRVRVTGHTDEVGTEQDNQVLSQARAEVVKAYLTQNFGLPADKLFTAAYGEYMPTADNETEKGRFLNRRVEFRIIK